MTYLLGCQFWKTTKIGFARIEQKWLHRMAISYPSKDLTLFCFGNLVILGIGTCPSTQVCQNYILGQLLMLWLLAFSRHPRVF